MQQLTEIQRGRGDTTVLWQNLVDTTKIQNVREWLAKDIYCKETEFYKAKSKFEPEYTHKSLKNMAEIWEQMEKKTLKGKKMAQERQLQKSHLADVHETFSHRS